MYSGMYVTPPTPTSWFACIFFFSINAHYISYKAFFYGVSLLRVPYPTGKTHHFPYDFCETYPQCMLVRFKVLFLRNLDFLVEIISWLFDEYSYKCMILYL